MAVEGLPQKQGASRAKIVCDECGRDECVACTYVKNQHSKSTEPNESQARAKAMGMGWSYVKGKLRCPSCEAKRKVVPMKAKEEPASAPQMTKREKIEIFTMLADVYDIDAGCYRNNDTDETVADVLGVRPGFVAQVRDAEFGPAGGNEEMHALRATLDECSRNYEALRKALSDAEKDVARIDTDMKAQKARMDSALSRLSAIQKAVGPRVMARA